MSYKYFSITQKYNIFYFMSDIFAVLNRKMMDLNIEKSYNQKKHEETIGYFFDFLEKKIQIFLIESAKKDSISNSQFNKALMDNILFCSVCLIDDIFIREKKEINHFWIENNLEKKIYGSQSAGDRFFSQIDKYILAMTSMEPTEYGQPEEISSFLLVYYLTLKSGFKGRIGEDKSQIRKVENKIFAYFVDTEESFSFPVIKRDSRFKRISLFSQFLRNLNGKFLAVHFFIALLFLILNTIIWEYKIFHIFELFR